METALPLEQQPDRGSGCMGRLLTAGCDSAAALAESVVGQAASVTDPSRQASQGETLGCCHILVGPQLVLVESYDWREACLVSAQKIYKKTF